MLKATVQAIRRQPFPAFSGFGPSTPMDQDGFLSYVVEAMRYPVSEIGFDWRLVIGCYRVMSLVPELARVVEDRYREEESRLRDELRASRAHNRIMTKIRAGEPDWAEIEKLVVDELPLPRGLKARLIRR